MRGYQRRVIYMKDTGSAIFDEAYFVVKENVYERGCGADMVSEATRIIEENGGEKKKRLCRLPTFREWIFSGIGFIGGAAISTLVAFLA